MATARVPRSAVARPLPERAPREQRHLKVVPEGRRLPIKLSPRTGVVLTLLLFVALFGVAVSHALLIESQAHLDELDEQVASEQDRYERLRLERAELESPDRIVAEAREMGMVPADDVTWLTPDQPAPAGVTPPADAEATETSDTSWADVKPYLEPTP
jgi:cell division protein FtsL